MYLSVAASHLTGPVWSPEQYPSWICLYLPAAYSSLFLLPEIVFIWVQSTISTDYIYFVNLDVAP